MTKELTNMICGNLFSRYDRVQGYALAIPEAEVIGFGEPTDPGPSPEGFGVVFLAEDRMIRLEIRLED